jgi:predicted Zn-dependent protease
MPLIFMGSWECSGRTPIGLLPAQRNAELEGHLLAVQSMARAGFDPNGLARFIQRISLPSPTPKHA